MSREHTGPAERDWSGLVGEVVAGGWTDALTGRPLKVATRAFAMAPSLAGCEAELVRGLGIGKRLAVVSGPSTYEAMGRRVEAALRAIGAVDVVAAEAIRTVAEATDTRTIRTAIKKENRLKRHNISKRLKPKSKRLNQCRLRSTKSRRLNRCRHLSTKSNLLSANSQRQHEAGPDHELRVPERKVEDLASPAARRPDRRPRVLMQRIERLDSRFGRRHEPWIPMRVRWSTIT